MSAKPKAQKQSFNLEPDVARLVAAWARRNRGTIKSRMFNAALRRYLAEFARCKKTEIEVAA